MPVASSKSVSESGIASLLEHLSRMIHSEGHTAGLYPAQWTALRYFARADQPSRTTAELSRFQGMRIGPVARTVRTLVEKGYLERRPNPRSKRADFLEVTPDGRALLEDDPLNNLASLLEQIPADEKRTFAEVLERIILLMFQTGEGLIVDEQDDSAKRRRPQPERRAS
ncbi:MarR family winged helix-turn-helix transcriptional regulator [Oceanibacterium hippocampi]|uniref:DNA-binding transcriptional repressor MarR n=1 Tax=Oceanibacterium hippocampi TaxID=745714 RepID=A0A1Y5T560_9PROT|nr:MarR family transcriptional regulator [Oceanibacterium hippocampi]SLN56023.1 DNA-binding transcriptional repressor MarR [Oceanibacterium hippocampi]